MASIRGVTNLGLGYCKMQGGEQKAVPDCDWHLNPSSANVGIGGARLYFGGIPMSPCPCCPAGDGRGVRALPTAGGSRAAGAGDRHHVYPDTDGPRRVGVRGPGTRPGTGGKGYQHPMGSLLILLYVTMARAHLFSHLLSSSTQGAGVGGAGRVGGCLPSGTDAVSSPHSARATWPNMRTRLPGCSSTW